MSWEDLLDCAPSSLKRSEEIQIKYDLFKKGFDSSTLENYIMSQFLDIRDCVLITNRFPYHIHPSIIQLDFWTETPMELKTVKKMLVEYIGYDGVIVCQKKPTNILTVIHVFINQI